MLFAITKFYGRWLYEQKRFVNHNTAYNNHSVSSIQLVFIQGFGGRFKKHHPLEDGELPKGKHFTL